MVIFGRKGDSSVDFNQIEITASELRLLKQLAGGPRIKSDRFERLIRFGLAREMFVVQTPGGMPVSGDTVEIDDPGRDYLIFVAAKKHDKKVEWIRYVITTVIAVAAIVIASIALLSQLQILELPKQKAQEESTSTLYVPKGSQSGQPTSLKAPCFMPPFK